MTNECIYSRYDVCEMLGITIYTIRNWYSWQKKQILSGAVDTEYLPQPEQQTHMKGKPLMWSGHMVEELREYQSNIVHGRNGVYGKYTNPHNH